MLIKTEDINIAITPKKKEYLPLIQHYTTVLGNFKQINGRYYFQVHPIMFKIIQSAESQQVNRIIKKIQSLAFLDL